jgi:hypothetical protein
MFPRPFRIISAPPPSSEILIDVFDEPYPYFSSHDESLFHLSRLAYQSGLPRFVTLSEGMIVTAK